MKQRIISGILIAAAVVIFGILGSYPLYLIMMLCSLIGYMELTAVLCPPLAVRRKEAPRKWNAFPDLMAIPGLLFTPVYYAGLMWIEWRYGLVNIQGMRNAANFWMLMIVSMNFLLTMAIYVYTFPRRRSSHATGAITSFFYATVLMSFVCRTRNLSHGIYLYLLIFVCSSISDVCALAVGMAIGRHKLAPVLSPKKTIEGAIGGIAGSAAVSCLVAVVLRHFEPGANVVYMFLIIGICGSIIGQTGDLAASAIKRNHQIKDYGNLIPGHGGIMDRFDSIIFTAPVIYYLSFLLMERL